MASSAANADLMGDDNGGSGAGDGGGGAGKSGNGAGDGASGKSGDGGDGAPDDGAGGGDDEDLLGDDKGGKEDGKKDGKKADKGADGAPAEYAIEVPKELEAFADKEALAEFAKLAKEQKLSKEQANAIARQAFERAKAQREALTQRMADASKTWHDEIANDEKIGGDKISQTKQDIALAIKKYAPPDFVKMARSFGAHNWPPLVRFIQAVGQDLRPDGGKINGGGGGSGKTETEEEMLARFYS